MSTQQQPGEARQPPPATHRAKADLIAARARAPGLGPPSRATVDAVMVGLGLALALAILARAGAPAQLPPAIDCALAAEVGGQLSCASELVGRLARVCPRARSMGALAEVQAGDVLELDDCAPTARLEAECLRELDVHVDLDRDDAATLVAIPGIGPVLAARIVAARPLSDIDAVDEVSGIGPRKLERVRAHACVRCPSIVARLRARGALPDTRAPAR